MNFQNLNQRAFGVTLIGACFLLAACGSKVDFGDDSSQWANDGECDDPRFEGRGMASVLVADDVRRDASDCRTLYDNGSIRLRNAG